MKKIFTIFVFVAATSFFACDQDLTGYEPKIGLTTKAKNYLTSKAYLLLDLCLTQTTSVIR